MAVTKPSVAAAAEVSEREYQSTVNAAVAATEAEIFADALGEGELDLDGDTSLEQMGDGLEGEVEDDEAEEGEAETEGEDGDASRSPQQAEGEDGEEAETAQAAGEEEGEEGEQPRDQRGQFRRDEPRVAPGRLKEEADKRRVAEERVQTLERQVAEYNGRVAELSARVNAAPKPSATEAPPKPDMFAEPEKYEAWLMAEAERKADARSEERFNRFAQQQQAREAQRVDLSLADAARGERAFEFGPAYNALTALDPRNPKDQATVRGIYNAPDPAKALFDWWDRNGGEEYREQVFSQLAPRMQQRQQRQPQRGQERAQPRHEIRPAQRLPSLNSATGSNSQRTSDPEMMDGSEASIFRYGTRP